MVVSYLYKEKGVSKGVWVIGMKHKFKEITLEVWEDNLGVHRVRLDNVLNDQYFEVLATKDKLQSLMLYQDLYDVLKKHQEL